MPHYDTGAWSLYQPGRGHARLPRAGHRLSRSCAPESRRPSTARRQHFEPYLKTPPVLRAAHRPSRASRSLRFRLSKVSHVGIVVHRAPDRVPTSARSPTAPTLLDPGAQHPAPTDPAGRDRPGGQLRPDHRNLQVSALTRARGDRRSRHRLARDAAADDPVHGQGRRRQDLRGGLHRARCAAAGCGRW